VPGSATLSIDQQVHHPSRASCIGGALRRLAVEPRVSEVDGESDSAQQGDPQSEQQKQNGLSRFARPAVRP